MRGLRPRILPFTTTGMEFATRHRWLHFSNSRAFPAFTRTYLLQATLRHPSQLEVFMRAWALQDPFVQSYQQRIDQRRLAYLAELIFLICQNRERAQCISQVFYSIYVGSQHILPPVQGDELEALYREVGRISDFLPAPDEYYQSKSVMSS